MSRTDAPLITDGIRPVLESWLVKEARASTVSVGGFQRLSGGAMSLAVAVTLDVTGGPRHGRHEVVLRASPGEEASSLGRLEEFAVMEAAFAAGVAAPEPLFACNDPAILGGAFYVLRRTDARGAQPVPSRELGRQLARLHRVTPAAGLEFLPLPEPTPALTTVRQLHAWLDDDARRDPVLAWALRWLEINALPASELVLCHRDCRDGSYLVRDGALAAIVDWEFAGWSDPMEDLGWCSVRQTRAGGETERVELYAGYEGTAGQPVDRRRVAYWEVAAYLRCVALALRQTRRPATAGESALELALDARRVPEIERDLLRHLRALETTGAWR